MQYRALTCKGDEPEPKLAAHVVMSRRKGEAEKDCVEFVVGVVGRRGFAMRASAPGLVPRRPPSWARPRERPMQFLIDRVAVKQCRVEVLADPIAQFPRPWIIGCRKRL
jgi:hypothetical protein